MSGPWGAFQYAIGEELATVGTRWDMWFERFKRLRKEFAKRPHQTKQCIANSEMHSNEICSPNSSRNMPTFQEKCCRTSNLTLASAIKSAQEHEHSNKPNGDCINNVYHRTNGQFQQTQSQFSKDRQRQT